MSTVQQIENALEGLTQLELAQVERRILELRKIGNDAPGYEYLHREYGVSPDEWQRFVQRQNRTLRSQIDNGEIKLFTGDIDSDLAD